MAAATYTSAYSEPAQDMKFQVVCGDVSMRITVNSKWQARPFEQAVVKAFVITYNKRVAEEDAVSVEALESVEIDGVVLKEALEKVQDAKAVVSTLVSPKAERVELFFGKPPPREIKVVVKADSQYEIKITLDRRWMAKNFEQAVVVPYLSLYNKRLITNPLDASQLFEVQVQGAKIDLPIRVVKEKLAGRLLQFHDNVHVDLFFSKGAVQSGGMMAKAHNSRFDIRYSRSDYAQAVELVWHHHGLTPGDATDLSKQIRDAGKLDKLKYLYLYNNDLRDAGVMAFADVCTKDHLPSLKQLLLHSNRIGDAGVKALCDKCDPSPGLDRLSLHKNCIGDEGAAALASALYKKTLDVKKMSIHSNPEMTAMGQELVRGVMGDNCDYDKPIAGRGPTPYIPFDHTPQRWIDNDNVKDKT